jgi:hypothetical protein
MYLLNLRHSSVSKKNRVKMQFESNKQIKKQSEPTIWVLIYKRILGGYWKQPFPAVKYCFLNDKQIVKISKQKGSILKMLYNFNEAIESRNDY